MSGGFTPRPPSEIHIRNSKIMGYAVYHLAKSKPSTNASGLGNHIDRKKGKEQCFKHANPELTHLNEEFCKTWQNTPLNEAVEQNIAKLYKGKTAIRKDAVKYISHILTGSHDEMKAIFADPDKKQNWLEANRDWIYKNFRKENIVRFTLHLDEKTPHLHVVTTAVTADGRLSAKELVGNNAKMEALQTSYAEAMKPFDLKRGLKGRATGHLPTSEFYKLVGNAVPSAQVEKKIHNTVEKNSIDLARFSTEIGQIIDDINYGTFWMKSKQNALKLEINKVLETAQVAQVTQSVKAVDTALPHFIQNYATETALRLLREEKERDRFQKENWEFRNERAKLKDEIFKLKNPIVEKKAEKEPEKIDKGFSR